MTMLMSLWFGQTGTFPKRYFCDKVGEKLLSTNYTPKTATIATWFRTLRPPANVIAEMFWKRWKSRK